MTDILIEYACQRIVELEARTEQQPVYQVCISVGKWEDCDKQRYDFHQEAPEQRRVLYTAPPAPAKTEQQSVAWGITERITL